MLDATGAEVGLVASLRNYYGQSASVVRAMTLPGGSGPEFVAFSVSGLGLVTSEYACNSYYGTYYSDPTCAGDRFQTCDSGLCSSAAGAFLFTSVAVTPEGVGCFARGGTEFRHGDFYHPIEVYGPSIAAATAACEDTGGRLLGPVTSCGSPPQFPNFCADCCALIRNLGVAPLHQVDLSAIGTPPFHLAR